MTCPGEKMEKSLFFEGKHPLAASGSGLAYRRMYLSLGFFSTVTEIHFREEKKMKKIIVLALLAAFALPGMSLPVFAEESGDMGMSKDMEMSMKTAVVDVGNKLCPVEGGPVSGQHFVTYEGKRYGLCCPMCDKTFLSDPAKYIAEMKKREPDLAT
jgi:YHS domain-containing protein